MKDTLISDLYNSKNGFINDIKRIKIILGSKEEYKNHLFIDEQNYISYYKKINLIKYFYNKVHMYYYLNKVQGLSIDYDLEDIKVIERDVKKFLKDLCKIERQNIDTLKLFNFGSDYLFIYQHIKKLDQWVDYNLDLYTELKSDMKVIKKIIKEKDYQLFKYYLDKSKKLSKLKQYSSLLEYKYKHNNLAEQKDLKYLLKILSETITSSEMKIEKLSKSLVDLNDQYEFSQQSQKTIIKTVQQVLHSDLIEIYEDLEQNIVINEKENKLIYDSKLETIILIQENNTFSGFINYLKLMSKSIHLQYSKYFNHYEFGHINYYEKNANFWLNFLISDAVMFEVSDKSQKKEIKELFNNYIFSSYKTSLEKLYVSLVSNKENSSISEISKAVNLFNFNELFIDEINFDAQKISNTIFDENSLKTYISIFIGISMYINLDKDDTYINNIIEYYKNGNKKVTVESIQTLNIDIYDLRQHKLVLDFIIDRIDSDK